MARLQVAFADLMSLRSAPFPVAVYAFRNRRVVCITLSEGFLDIFGFSDLNEAMWVMDTDMYRDAHPSDVARIADAAFRYATEDGVYDVYYRTRERGVGDYVCVHAQGYHVYAEDGERYAVVTYANEGLFSAGEASFDDMLARRHADSVLKANVEHNGFYDTLTGLPNMGYFLELAPTIHAALKEAGKPCVLLYIDLVGMKFYNRSHGFAGGDSLIRAVGRVLKKRFSNENCSRLGQDDFAVVCEATRLDESLASLIEELEVADDGEGLPVRIGVYLDDMGDVTASVACDRAKMAADAKRDSLLSSVTYFDAELLASLVRKRHIIDNFDRALKEGWIKVFYQPIVRAVNGMVADEEALARWYDPEQGLLSPAEFIGVLEDSRLIYLLDLYVLEQALDRMVRRQAAGRRVIPVSVNLSRSDFEVCDMVEEVRRRVADAGVSPQMVTVEITESTIGSDVEYMKRQVERFHEFGFEVWMDDFGSEYSSLDYLQMIPFDLIKLDMRFMRQFETSEKSRMILAELVRLALALGLKVVAEGVETADQVSFLREIGCTKIQGYFFGRPLPEEEIEAVMRQGGSIGLEDPDEAAYYSALGAINLSDVTSLVSDEDGQGIGHFFSTFPMAIAETSADMFRICRSNASYRLFTERFLGLPYAEAWLAYPDAKDDRMVDGFLPALRQCAETGGRVVLDERLESGYTVHAFVRHVALNPVTGVSAVAIVIFAVNDRFRERQGISFAHMARALSADYIDLFYVDLETDEFVEYSSDAMRAELSSVGRGADFFEKGRAVAKRRLFEADREDFLRMFTKENMVSALDEHGSFRLTYRIVVDGEPVYVSLKALRIAKGDPHIVIGLSNVDAQMRQQEALEHVRREQSVFRRISALADELICIYVVDPVSSSYTEYSVIDDYDALGLAKEGTDFFAESRENAADVLDTADLEPFREAFTRENVMRAIGERGLFSLSYRLMVGGDYTLVELRARIIEEPDGSELVVGVMRRT